jgi:hypothetical protein
VKTLHNRPLANRPLGPMGQPARRSRPSFRAPEAKPVKPPRYGWARARHEWRIWRMTLIAVAISLGVLELLGWLADGAGSGVTPTSPS